MRWIGKPDPQMQTCDQQPVHERIMGLNRKPNSCGDSKPWPTDAPGRHRSGHMASSSFNKRLAIWLRASQERRVEAVTASSTKPSETDSMYPNDYQSIPGRLRSIITVLLAYSPRTIKLRELCIPECLGKHQRSRDLGSVPGLLWMDTTTVMCDSGAWKCTR